MLNAFPTVRHPLLSLLQSAAAAIARRQSPNAAARGPYGHPLTAAAAELAAAQQDPTRGYSPPANTTVPAATCVGLGLELLEALLAGDKTKQTSVRNRIAFSQCDPRWAETLTEYATNLQLDGKPRPVPYRRYKALGDYILTAERPTLRIGLLSDWGTGTQVARAVIDLLARQQPDVIIHLGDIYFSGTAEECGAHFYAPMRAALPNGPIFTLCGNHDVYSGRQGYSRLLDRIGQPASYFCLRSPDCSWQILAGDTGLNDRDPFDAVAALTKLDLQEEAWHVDKLQGFPGRTVFLTHHMPFSAFVQIGPLAANSPVNPNLMASYARLAAVGTIDAWFWGHEHRLRLYAPYRGVTRGRNIGHAAIPVEAARGPATPIASLVDPPTEAVQITLDVVEGAYDHGFAMLDLGPDGIDASYWAVTRPGGPIYRESFGRSKQAIT